MILEIITPAQNVYSGEVIRVKVPGTKGSFEILKDHAPIISTLENGEVRIVDKDQKQVLLQIQGGIVEVLKNKILLLTEGANGGDAELAADS